MTLEEIIQDNNHLIQDHIDYHKKFVEKVKKDWENYFNKVKSFFPEELKEHLICEVDIKDNILRRFGTLGFYFSEHALNEYRLNQITFCFSTGYYNDIAEIYQEKNFFSDSTDEEVKLVFCNVITPIITPTHIFNSNRIYKSDINSILSLSRYFYNRKEEIQSILENKECYEENDSIIYELLTTVNSDNDITRKILSSGRDYTRY